MKNTKTNDKAYDNGNNVIETILKVIKNKEGLSDEMRAVDIELPIAWETN